MRPPAHPFNRRTRLEVLKAARKRKVETVTIINIGPRPARPPQVTEAEEAEKEEAQ